MKTNFERVDGCWVSPTGKVVAADFINLGDDYDVILADQYIDVCTGKTYVKRQDDFSSEKSWKLVKHYDVMDEYCGRHGNRKKLNRAGRISEMCGVHWTKPYETKRIGKNRRLARRMWPNAKQLAEYNEYLPF